MAPGACHCGLGWYQNRTCIANCGNPRGPGHPRHPMHRSRHAARVRSRSPSAPVLHCSSYTMSSSACPGSVCQPCWAAKGWKCKHCRRECWHTCDACRLEWTAFGWKCSECKGEGRRTLCNLCYWKGPIRITVRDPASNVQGPFEMSASTTIESLESFLRDHIRMTCDVNVKGASFS